MTLYTLRDVYVFVGFSNFLRFSISFANLSIIPQSTIIISRSSTQHQHILSCQHTKRVIVYLMHIVKALEKKKKKVKRTPIWIYRLVIYFNLTSSYLLTYAYFVRRIRFFRLLVCLLHFLIAYLKNTLFSIPFIFCCWSSYYFFLHFRFLLQKNVLSMQMSSRNTCHLPWASVIGEGATRHKSIREYQRC